MAKYPGPKITAISRLPLVWSTIKGETWQFTGKLHQKYGPIVRIAPDELATTSSGAWEDIYIAKPLAPKDPFSQTPPMNGAESLFTAAGETHHRIRKTFINAFSDRALKDQSPIIEEYSNQLITRLRREMGKNPMIDIAKFYGYATLDVIADLTFGEPFYGLEGDNEHSWIVGFFLGAKFGSVRNSLSRYHPIDKIFGWIFLRLTAKNRATSWRIATDMISRRLEMGDLGPSRSDFITPVVGRLDESQTKGITRKELNTNGLAVVIAGCQLTTVALATSTYLLLRYPKTLKLLTKEIRDSFESQTDITVTSTAKLPYLEAVINETLRIHHPTPINLPRVIPPEGQKLDGDWIPGGVSIFVYQRYNANMYRTLLASIYKISKTILITGSNLVFSTQRDSCPKQIPDTTRDSTMTISRLSNLFLSVDVIVWVESKYPFYPKVYIDMCRVFLAEARMILAKTIWNFELEMANPDDWNWLDQKAYLVFEPKELIIKLSEKVA